jgi:hypothetical protein
MSFLVRLNRPWIHFILLGVLLFYIKGLLFPQPKPVIGPLNPARLEALQQQWLRATGRMPTPEQQARMVSSELDRDMLFQRALALDLHLYDTVVYQRLLRNMKFLGLAEGKTDQELFEQALEMRLHLGDEVVKRRLIQIMEQLVLLGNPPSAPTEEEIAAEFEERKEELRRPPRYSIEHVYLSREREAEVDEVAAKILEQGLGPEEALQFNAQTPDQLARNFGVAFVENLQAAGPEAGHWIGPIRSTYGLHFVWVSEVEPGRDATLEEVRTQLVRDLESRARASALEEGIAALRQDYEVRI